MTGGSGGDADVVVVGAGAAGCVVARRLADAGADVLLLEAGTRFAPGAATRGRARRDGSANTWR